MPAEFDRGSPGKFDSRTLSRKTLSRWAGRICICRKIVFVSRYLQFCASVVQHVYV